MNNSNQDIATENETLSIREQSTLHWEALSKQPVIFSWTTQRERKGDKTVSIVMSSIVLAIALSCFIFFDNPIGKYGISATFLCVALFAFCGSYFWGAADDYYEYHLTQQGIYYTHTQLVPEIVFKFVRGFSYVGILVCIVAGVILGPTIFFGAGVFALMSFGMTNIKSSVSNKVVCFISDSYLIKHVKAQGAINIFGQPFDVLSFSNLYCNLDEKKFIMDWFYKNLNISEIEEVPHVKDL